MDNLFINQVLHFSTATRLTFSPPFINETGLGQVVEEIDRFKIIRYHIVSTWVTAYLRQAYGEMFGGK